MKKVISNKKLNRRDKLRLEELLGEYKLFVCENIFDTIHNSKDIIYVINNKTVDKRKIGLSLFSDNIIYISLWSKLIYDYR